ncbi:MAG: hypothetical protein KA740_10215 [Rhodoferax sp.]|jgi:hypothetical protein|nr:hypothetical protein [Rhodoferax sp.]
MNAELLRTEVDLAEQAEIESDDQIRKLTALITKSCEPNASVSASDCSKLVAAALALNERLRERTRSLKNALQMAERNSQ